MRAALVLLLRSLGYVPIPAASVAEGVARLDGQIAAILDLELPDGLGTLILARIRAERRPIRVAITSGTTDDAALAEAHRLRPELFMRKPIDVEALIDWLNAERE